MHASLRCWMYLFEIVTYKYCFMPKSHSPLRIIVYVIAVLTALALWLLRQQGDEPLMIPVGWGLTRQSHHAFVAWCIIWDFGGNITPSHISSLVSKRNTYSFTTSTRRWVTHWWIQWKNTSSHSNHICTGTMAWWSCFSNEGEYSYLTLLLRVKLWTARATRSVRRRASFISCNGYWPHVTKHVHTCDQTCIHAIMFCVIAVPPWRRAKRRKLALCLTIPSLSVHSPDAFLVTHKTNKPSIWTILGHSDKLT